MCLEQKVVDCPMSFTSIVRAYQLQSKVFDFDPTPPTVSVEKNRRAEPDPPPPTGGTAGRNPLPPCPGTAARNPLEVPWDLRLELVDLLVRRDRGQRGDRNPCGRQCEPMDVTSGWMA